MGVCHAKKKVQTGSEANPVPCAVCTGVHSLGGKFAVDHSPTSSAEIMNDGTVTLLLLAPLLFSPSKQMSEIFSELGYIVCVSCSVVE